MKSAEVSFRRPRRSPSGVSYGIRIAGAELLRCPADVARALAFLLEQVDQDQRVQGVSVILDHPIFAGDIEQHRGFWVYVLEPHETSECTADMLALGERLRAALTDLRAMGKLAGQRGIE